MSDRNGPEYAVIPAKAGIHSLSDLSVRIPAVQVTFLGKDKTASMITG